MAKVRHQVSNYNGLSPNLSKMRWSQGSGDIRCISYPMAHQISQSQWGLNSVLYTFKLGRTTLLAAQGSWGWLKTTCSSLHKLSGLRALKGRAGLRTKDWAGVPYLLSRARVSMTNLQEPKVAPQKIKGYERHRQTLIEMVFQAQYRQYRIPAHSKISPTDTRTPFWG